MFGSYGLNRFVCDVLEELRTHLKIAVRDERELNMAMSLIEEAQVLVNRMEAALHDLNDLEQLHKEIKERKKELKELEEKKDEL